MGIKERFGKEIIILDGACGTTLQSCYGLKAGEKPELWCLTKPEIIKEMHLSYLKSGAEIILANTFGANKFKFGDSTKNIIEAAINIAKSAIKENDGKGLVALDIGPLGKLLAPFGELKFDEAYEVFKEIVVSGKNADVIVIETMTDLYEIKAAILAAKENSSLPIIASVTLDANSMTLTGADIETVATLIEGLGVDVIGLNCGFGPQKMLEWIPSLIKLTNLPIMIKPNAGLPYIVNGKLQFDTSEEEFFVCMEKAVELGVSLIGGCCGTTNKYIERISKLKTKKVLNRDFNKEFTRISSYAKTVNIGNNLKPVIIGERLNPTGKPALKEALRKGDFDYLKKEALKQVESGANILDINVGLPDICEKEMLKEVVFAVQSISNIPIQIDSANTLALEYAIRQYNGIPLINSVNGKKESMEAVFPLMQKYGGIAVALMLDENGISEDVQERIKVAKKIILEAKKYGINKNRLLFDPLAMTISTNFKNAINVLDILKICKNELGVSTVLGVSNISFGLPERATINATFFAEALSSGLSAGIIDPNSKVMIDVYNSFLAIHGYDANFELYIKNYSGNSTKLVEKAEDITLEQAIVKGLAKEAEIVTVQLLKKGIAPLAIINEILIPALDIVGKNFETKTIFLPQLLSSAESAKSAFGVLKRELKTNGATEQSKGTIVLATVEGDIHDIGKNIVKVILENYGYNIVDLGRDVKAETILDAIRANNAGLVGLSALMTTTVSNMELTIKFLKSHVNCLIMVGGAVLTESYASKIGADFYAKDAMASAKIAEKVFSQIKKLGVNNETEL